MRQAGLKPKSHNSGVYWVRASSSNGGGESKKETHEESPLITPIAFILTLLAVVWYYIS